MGNLQNYVQNSNEGKLSSQVVSHNTAVICRLLHTYAVYAHYALYSDFLENIRKEFALTCVLWLYHMNALFGACSCCLLLAFWENFSNILSLHAPILEFRFMHLRDK